VRYAFLFWCTGLAAQELGVLSTERPGYAATSGAVGLGVLQLEQGYTLESAREPTRKVTTYSGPQALVRFGVSDALELRFATNGYAWRSEVTEVGQRAVSGPNDFVVGAKFRIVTQGTARPEFSITGGLSVPARGSFFSTAGYDPSFTLAAYKDLRSNFSLSANLNMASITDSRGRFYSAGQSLSAGRGFRVVSIFAEAFHTTRGREGSQTTVDGGAFRGLGKHAQIDVCVGHTIAAPWPAQFISLGLVLRNPRALLVREK
jgi:hypothetical protein